MVKKFLNILILIVLSTVLAGCTKDKAIILFNREPITKESILNNSSIFRPGDRIYYAFISQKPISGDYIRVQVFKKDEKTAYAGAKVIWANDYKIREDNIFYYTDYVVLWEPGHYFMQVFDKNFRDTPLAFGNFYVRD